MKKIPLVFLILAVLLCTQSGVHMNPPTPTLTPTPTATFTPTPVPNGMLDLIMDRVKREPPVRLETGEWAYLEPDDGEYEVFVWRGNLPISEMHLRQVIGAWIASQEWKSVEIRLGPAWSSEGKPSSDISQSSFGLYIRVGDEEVFWQMLYQQPPYLRDC